MARFLVAGKKPINPDESILELMSKGKKKKVSKLFKKAEKGEIIRLI